MTFDGWRGAAAVPQMRLQVAADDKWTDPDVGVFQPLLLHAKTHDDGILDR